MKTLSRMLGEMLGGRPKPAPRKDYAAADRAAFKRLAGKHGLAFAKASDGYLEAPATERFPLGVTFAHHGWHESRGRLELILADPGVLDAHGYYSE